ncbi:unnamed protein product (macronuclear) [Paramecium tetraurelia]|uniref:Ankyrin repeat domain-containing protein n=1 Tax=Paramecium tetraurelia TaxID=5888 RepID=A0D828_PARTE|nr:uncharacterized protein GSPATT00014162001 [Paramecium tetraurelia]CAK79195.1 unnamed protein product [Paramecium tetraurelia]|eukprot:XP_001446592.1 hypothetical protein (macronuclear) [Paramecium tetraurelia strain d4-2]
MLNYDKNDDEHQHGTVQEQLEKLKFQSLEPKSSTISFKNNVRENRKQSHANIKARKEASESISESSYDDQSELYFSEFDIMNDNKKAKILCEYKNSYFNEKIKVFNEIKSKQIWPKQQPQLNQDEASVQLIKSSSIMRQQSSVSESNHNTISLVRRIKEFNDFSVEQSLKQINSPLIFYIPNNHQFNFNSTQINNNFTSSHAINNRSSQQIKENSQYTIDIPCDSLGQQSAKHTDKDLQLQIIEAIFSKNVFVLIQMIKFLQKEYRTEILNQKDVNGNTPLLLAIKLSHQQNQFEIIRLLLSSGCDPSIKDLNGWSPIEETVAQMDVATTSILFDYLVQKRMFDIQQERNQIDQELLRINDFYLEMKWEFKSNLIPFISKITPNDTFKIYKRGSSLRLDSTFAGTKNYKTKRRDISVFYNPMIGPSQRKENQSNCRFVIILNRTKKIYYYPIQEIDIEEKEQIILDLLHCDSVSGEMKVTQCDLIKRKNIFGNYVSQKINNLVCQKYEFRIQGNKQFRKKQRSHYSMNFEQYIKQNFDSDSRQDKVNFEPWAQEIIQNDGNSKKQQKLCQLYISKEFPLDFRQFLPIIKMLARGNEMLQSLLEILLSETVKQVLNDNGFPVRIEIPINFTIDGVVTFQNYTQIDFDNSEIIELFQIPSNFTLMQRRDATKVMKRQKKRLILANLFL